MCINFALHARVSIVCAFRKFMWISNLDFGNFAKRKENKREKRNKKKAYLPRAKTPVQPTPSSFPAWDASPRLSLFMATQVTLFPFLFLYSADTSAWTRFPSQASATDISTLPAALSCTRACASVAWALSSASRPCTDRSVASMQTPPRSFPFWSRSRPPSGLLLTDQYSTEFVRIRSRGSHAGHLLRSDPYSQGPYSGHRYKGPHTSCPYNIWCSGSCYVWEEAGVPVTFSQSFMRRRGSTLYRWWVHLCHLLRWETSPLFCFFLCIV